MKRCIDSGMWVPDASDLEKVGASAEPAPTAPPADAASADTEDEEIYEDASSSPKKE